MSNLIDQALDNLEQAKEIDGDGAQKVPNNPNEDYEDKANYKLTCQGCGQVAYRIQLKGSVREDAEGKDRIECAECGGNFNCEEV